MTNTTELWTAHSEAKAARDDARNLVATLAEKISLQEELIAGAPTHNAALVEAQIEAELDGTKSPKQTAIDIAFETAKLDALRERHTAARAVQATAQAKAEATLTNARSGEKALLAAWSKSTSTFHPANGRQSIDHSDICLSELAASFAASRAAGGVMGFADWIGLVIGFEDLDALVSDARVKGLAWDGTENEAESAT